MPSCPRPRRGPGRGSTWTPAALRLVGRLAGAGREVSVACLPAAVLKLVLAREWLFRRAGLSGCESATPETASFPGCPPRSLPLRVSCRRVSSIIRWWSVSLILRFSARSAALATHPFGDLALVVGAAFAAGAADLVTAAMWMAWLSCRLPRRESRWMTRSLEEDLDGDGAVVGGESVAGGEAAGVANVAEHRAGDDRPDAVDAGDRGSGRGHRLRGAAFGVPALLIRSPVYHRYTSRLRRGDLRSPVQRQITCTVLASVTSAADAVLSAACSLPR